MINKKSLVLTLMILLISACGNKGPLYQEQPTAEPENSQQQPSNKQQP